MKRTLFLILFGSLVACSESSTPTENVFQTQIDALDKAKAVEQLMLDAAAEQQAILEDLD